MVLAELRNKAGQLAAEIRKLGEAAQERRAKGQPLFDESSQAAYDKVNKEYDELRAKIDDEEKADALMNRVKQIEEEQARSTRHGRAMPGLDDTIPGESRTYGDAGFEDRSAAQAFAQREVDKRNAMAAFLLLADDLNHEKVSRSQIESCQRLGFDPYKRSGIKVDTLQTTQLQDLQRQARSTIRYKDIDVRNLARPDANSGAELVPQTFAATFELAMLATSPMLAYVDTISTSTGENFLWPIGNDTFVEGALADESADLNSVTQTMPHLTRLTLGAFDYHSRFIKVTEQLLRDSIVNIDQIVATMIGERLGRILLRHATVGTGSGQPAGVVTDSVAGVAGATTTTITYANLLGLQHSVDPSYRGNGVFMAHDQVIRVLRGLLDSQNRPLWQSGLQEGAPDRLLGQPIIYNQYMASSVAANAITMLYGDMSYYKLRRVGGMTMRRLVERFAETREVGFIGYISADGRLQKPGGSNAADVCPVKRLTQPAS